MRNIPEVRIPNVFRLKLFLNMPNLRSHVAPKRDSPECVLRARTSLAHGRLGPSKKTYRFGKSSPRKPLFIWSIPTLPKGAYPETTWCLVMEPAFGTLNPPKKSRKSKSPHKKYFPSVPFPHPGICPFSEDML